jgi:beta-glucosidase
MKERPLIDRRTALSTTAAVAVVALGLVRASTAPGRDFPNGFLWGAASAAYQVEGNNINSDVWAMEHAQPTAYVEPAGDAANSFALWPTDLDLVKTWASTPIASASNGAGSSLPRVKSPSRCSTITRR